MRSPSGRGERLLVRPGRRLRAAPRVGRRAARRRAASASCSPIGGLLGFVLYAAELLERRPGRVLVEAPSYDRPLKILAREGAEIVAARDGRRGARSRRARARARADAPSHPRSCTRSRRSRTRAGARSRPSAGAASPRSRRAHGLPVLEDDPYGLVRYEGDAPPTLHELEGGELVTYTSSFSKTVAPGLRTGLLRAPGRRRGRVRGARGLDVHLAAVPRAGDDRRVHRARPLRAEPRARARRAARAARRDARGARAQLPGRRVVEPSRGRVLRLARPRRRARARRSSRRARPRRGVAFVRGEDFFPRGLGLGATRPPGSRSATSRPSGSPRASTAGCCAVLPTR